MKTDAARCRKRQLNFISITRIRLCDAGWPLSQAGQQLHSLEPSAKSPPRRSLGVGDPICGLEEELPRPIVTWAQKTRWLDTKANLFTWIAIQAK